MCTCDMLVTIIPVYVIWYALVLSPNILYVVFEADTYQDFFLNC